MSKFTRIISLILAAALVCAAVPVSALVEPSGTRGDVTYSFDKETGVLTFSGTGEIPYELCPDSPEISEHCTSVVVEEGITAWGDGNIVHLRNIESISLPTTLQFFGEGYSSGLHNLLSFTVAEGNPWLCSVDGVLYSADMTVLEKVPTGLEGPFQIPSCCTKIGFNALGWCFGITDVIIPDSITTIESFAFQHTRLTEITIPSSVTTIAPCAFFFSESLKSITLPKGLESLGNSCFFYSDCLETITIPVGVTSIGEGTFWLCESLREVTILGDIAGSPNGYAIGSNAFAECLTLEKLVIRSRCPDPETIAAGAFADCPDGVEVYYPCNCPEWAEVKPFDTDDLHFVYIPDAPIPLALGDANGDGVINMGDISAVSAYLLGKGTLSEDGLLNADASGNGVVDAADLAAIFDLI